MHLLNSFVYGGPPLQCIALEGSDFQDAFTLVLQTLWVFALEPVNWEAYMWRWQDSEIWKVKLIHLKCIFKTLIVFTAACQLQSIYAVWTPCGAGRARRQLLVDHRGDGSSTIVDHRWDGSTTIVNHTLKGSTRLWKGQNSWHKVGQVELRDDLINVRVDHPVFHPEYSLERLTHSSENCLNAGKKLGQIDQLWYWLSIL